MPEAIRRLDHRARVVLGLFAGKEIIRAPDVAKELGLSERMDRNLLTGWVKDGWLEATSPSRRARAQMSFNASPSNLNANKLITHKIHNSIYVSKNPGSY